MIYEKCIYWLYINWLNLGVILGRQGDKGDRGLDGLPGLPGKQGPQGPQGSPGLTGFKGVKVRNFKVYSMACK